MSATTGRDGRQAGPTERRLRAGEEPLLGAHLVSPRRLYTHHGVYAGAGRVIHYAGLSSSLRAGPVEEVSLEEFAGGHAVAVRVGTSMRFGGEQVVQRARSRLGESCYRVFTNNCEHFCEWCLSGESCSGQIDAWLAPLRQARERARQALSSLRPASVGYSAANCAAG